MNTVPSGTVIGYDVVSGKELFSERNRATRFPDQTSALPKPNDTYTVDGKNYRIIGVRADSTELVYKIDVREEEPSG
jgi:hypothetical protein